MSWEATLVPKVGLDFLFQNILITAEKWTVKPEIAFEDIA
jgi:hypothetical protein